MLNRSIFDFLLTKIVKLFIRLLRIACLSLAALCLFINSLRFVCLSTRCALFVYRLLRIACL